MRVYLPNGKMIQKPGGATITWPADSFAVVSDALGHEWLDDGTAFPSTPDNVAIIPEPPLVVEEEEEEEESTPGPSFDASLVDDDEGEGE